MVFASPIFIFYFLPTVFLFYFVSLELRSLCRKYLNSKKPDIPKSMTVGNENIKTLYNTFFMYCIEKIHSFWLPNFIILLFSLAFYYWGETNKTLILLAVILFNFYIGRCFAPSNTKIGKKRRKTFFILCLVLNIGCLFVFKYLTFTVSLITGSLGIDYAIKNIGLPLGISFFIFQAMSYVIDIYCGTINPNKSLTGFACYISMFPQLVAGPIVRYTDIAAQLQSRTISFPRFASGVERFAFGLAKKVLIANHVAIFADTVFSLKPELLTSSLAWVGVLCYTIQIYYDFSGYSDMAIGIGRMLGFDFKENFLFPYAAISMQDFWRRWHISLSTWFRDYLYIPLGGNRKGIVRTYINLCIVFVLCGLWHGAALNFILWGIYHGIFLIIERIGKFNFTKHSSLGRTYTIFAILFGWLLFRAESFEQIVNFLQAMFGFAVSTTPDKAGYWWLWFSIDIKFALVAGLIFSQPVYTSIFQRIQGKNTSINTSSFVSDLIPYGRIILVFGLLLACVPFLVNDSYNPFIYFRF